MSCQDASETCVTGERRTTLIEITQSPVLVSVTTQCARLNNRSRAISGNDLIYLAFTDMTSCLVSGKGQSFDNAFAGMKSDPGQIAVSFYSGIFSYAGWWVARVTGPIDSGVPPPPGRPVSPEGPTAADQPTFPSRVSGWRRIWADGPSC